MKKVLIAAIRFYQKYISPYKGDEMPLCAKLFPVWTGGY